MKTLLRHHATIIKEASGYYWLFHAAVRLNVQYYRVYFKSAVRLNGIPAVVQVYHKSAVLRAVVQGES
jgi:hypothetical protein